MIPRRAAGRRVWWVDTLAPVAAVLALLIGFAQPAAADPAEQTPDAATVARINLYLADQVAERGLPGAEFALVSGTSVVALSATGVPDGTGRKLTPRRRCCLPRSVRI
jgi:hypothetical protein